MPGPLKVVASDDAKTANREPAAMPPALRTAYLAALAKDAGEAHALNAQGCARVSSLDACFTRSGAHFTGAAPLSLQLAAWGRGDDLAKVSTTEPRLDGNEVRYAHGNLTEWWKVLPVGFEQGFTIAKRPAGSGELTLALAANEPATEAKGDLAWGKLRYGQLVVTDAKGHVIPATLKTEGRQILIAVNDAHATYPLTVDPLVWFEQKVTASDGAIENVFGYSVALSGTTAIVGAFEATVNGNAYQGAAYIFSDAGGNWTQTAKLTANGGATYNYFGYSVALSGTTALVGAYGATVNGNHGQGAAYIFSDAGGSWTETAELVASDGAANDTFGTSVALSGTTALVGALAATVNGHLVQGAAYVFSDAGGSWLQTAKLTASDGAADDELGTSVALSGTTALVGASNATINGNAGQGAAYAFSNAGGSWTETAKLTASDGAAYNYFGMAVALSGTTVLVGVDRAAVNSNADQGAVYVFSDAGGSWTETQKLTASDGATYDYFGNSVALSGTTALVGADDATVNGNAAQGAAYVFSDAAGSWAETQKLVASDGAADDSFGSSVALSGTTALVGADSATVNGNVYQGEAYFQSMANLGLAINAPASVAAGTQYQAEVILTNSAATATPAVAAAIPVPSGASFVSATPAQGACTPGSTSVSCALGAIAGNGGTAKVAVTFKATGAIGTSIANAASVTNTSPALTANANTAIIGIPVVSLSPASLAFGTVAVGASAAAQTVTLTNTGTADLTNVALSLTGTNAADFAETSTCAATLPSTAGSNSCTITVSFKPTASGAASATLSIASNAAGSPNTVTLTGTGDVPPVANNQSLNVYAGQALAGQLTASASSGGTLTYAAVTQPAHGTLTLTASSGSFTYTPAAGYTGSDSFTFTASDGVATSNVASVTIIVNAAPVPPTAPVANNLTLTATEGQGATGQLTATASSGGTLTYAAVTQPAHGTLTLTASSGAFTYTPAAGYTGSDGFTFTANDATSTSNTATVTINVTPGSAPPSTAVLAFNMSVWAPVGGSVTGKLSAQDVDGQPLTYTVVIKPVHGSLSLNAQTGAFTYTPAAGFEGDSFTYTASDGTTTSAPANVTVYKQSSGAGAFGIWGLLLLAPLVGWRKRRV